MQGIGVCGAEPEVVVARAVDVGGGVRGNGAGHVQCIQHKYSIDEEETASGLPQGKIGRRLFAREWLLWGCSGNVDVVGDRGPEAG